MICKVEGCDKEANGPGAARGYCARHYRQWGRGTLGKTRPRAAPGDGDEVTFRLSAPEKEALLKLAKRHRCTLSEICRAAVREYLEALG